MATSKGKRQHKGYKTAAYQSWIAMKKRCRYVKHPCYHRYGGRGITVCDRWIDSFENFLADMGPRPEGMTLDRIDNDGNYEPGNCKWSTRAEQTLKRRCNRNIEYRGKTQTLKEWCDELGLKRPRINERLRRGWSVKDAFERPSLQGRKHQA